MEAPGCACFTLCIDGDWNGKFSGRLKLESPASRMVDTRKVARHDTRCPVAERASVRRKLLEEIERLSEDFHCEGCGRRNALKGTISPSALHLALNRICPEEG